MKTWLKGIASVAIALSLVASVATAGSLTISAQAQNGSNYYDSMNVSVPAGAYCSYYEYVIVSGSASVRITGPGVSIDDTIYGGTSNGGNVFTYSGGVFASVYASSGGPGSQATASVTVGW